MQIRIIIILHNHLDSLYTEWFNIINAGALSFNGNQTNPILWINCPRKNINVFEVLG